MPNINDTVYNLSMGYIFTFDFGSEDILHLNDKTVLEKMKEAFLAQEYESAA